MGESEPGLLHLEHIIISIDHTFQLLSVTQMAALLNVTDDVWAFINLFLSSSAPPRFHPSVGGTCAIVCQLPILKLKKKVSDFLGCESRSVSVCLTLQPECFFQRLQRCGRIRFDTLAFLGFLLSVQCFQKNAEPSYL